MLTSLRWLFVPALIAGLLGPVAPARAIAVGTAFPVEDGAKMFSKDAVEKANKKIEDIKRKYGKDLLIETFAEVPDNLKEKLKDQGKEKFFETWAAKRYQDKGVDGVSVLICKDPTYLFIEMGEDTARKAFTRANRRTLKDKMLASLKAKKPDEALLTAVDFVDSTFEANGVKPKKTSSDGRTSAVPIATKTKTNPIWGWICIGIVVLLGVWLLFGLIRAFTGGGGGGGGGGYGGGGGGGYGGGGGGFLSSLVGGMFGAAAGMYLYDSFFRDHSGGGSGWGSSAQAGDASSPADNRPVGGDGGGDWGGGGGSGNDDAGGGGGDWGGGGGDAGGGGDWGGGGGDAGGGGDWGGGGGDMGGGGGDW